VASGAAQIPAHWPSKRTPPAPTWPRFGRHCPRKSGPRSRRWSGPLASEGGRDPGAAPESGSRWQPVARLKKAAPVGAAAAPGDGACPTSTLSASAEPQKTSGKRGFRWRWRCRRARKRGGGGPDAAPKKWHEMAW